MSTYVVDTSVTIAWYLEEDFSANARTWQERLLEGKVNLVVPSLHYWEFANALRSLVARTILAEELAHEIFDLHLDAPLDVSEPDRRDVMKNALEYEATVYDAVFITLALARDAQIVTAERTTTRWITKLAGRALIVR